jgi:hypothetical protein
MKCTRKAGRATKPLAVGLAIALGALSTTNLAAQNTCEDVSGVWNLELSLPGVGVSPVTLTLEQAECTVTGTVVGRARTEIQDGTVEGHTARFIATGTNGATGEAINIPWEATVDGDEISGTLAGPMGDIEFSGSRAEG